MRRYLLLLIGIYCLSLSCYGLKNCFPQEFWNDKTIDLGDVIIGNSRTIKISGIFEAENVVVLGVSWYCNRYESFNMDDYWGMEDGVVNDVFTVGGQSIENQWINDFMVKRGANPNRGGEFNFEILFSPKESKEYEWTLTVKYYENLVKFLHIENVKHTIQVKVKARGVANLGLTGKYPSEELLVGNGDKYVLDFKEVIVRCFKDEWEYFRLREGFAFKFSDVKLRKNTVFSFLIAKKSDYNLNVIFSCAPNKEGIVRDTADIFIKNYGTISVPLCGAGRDYTLLNYDITKMKREYLEKEFKYTGQPITLPGIVFFMPKTDAAIYSDNDSTDKVTEFIKMDVEYDIFYKNNINPGIAMFVVKGKGKWKGTIIGEFLIKE